MVIVAGDGHSDTSSNPGLIAFHITLIPLEKVWIQLLSLQLWVNSRTDCYVLTFWPGQKCYSRWRTGRKWHILKAVMRGNRVGGNWLMKWDEVKKIPLYSHRLTHRKRVTSELHDSYFRSMTITQAIPNIAEVTHPERSKEIAEAWRRVHITAWEVEGNIRLTNWTEEDSWVQESSVGDGDRRDVIRKASTQQTELQGSGWAAMENEKDTTLTAITLGSKYFSYVRSPAPSHTQSLSNPLYPYK